MNKAEAVRRLLYKMKLVCSNCKDTDLEQCKECAWYMFTNLMLEELDGN